MNKKVLIIEDEDLYSNILKQSLEKKGYQVMLARNGKEGYDITLKEFPDVIILDLVMPQMSGEEFMNQLRKDEWGKKAKVIVLTNKSFDEQTMNVFVETEPSFYLQKVDNPLEEVLEKVDQVLKV